jgi:hypothetical protein
MKKHGLRHAGEEMFRLSSDWVPILFAEKFRDSKSR